MTDSPILESREIEQAIRAVERAEVIAEIEGLVAKVQRKITSKTFEDPNLCLDVMVDIDDSLAELTSRTQSEVGGDERGVMNTLPNNVSTYGFYPGDKLTLDNIEEAIAKINPMTDELVIKIEVCKKHYEHLLKVCAPGNFNGIGGIPLFVVPYLKKARVYQKNGIIKHISITKVDSTPPATAEEGKKCKAKESSTIDD